MRSLSNYYKQTIASGATRLFHIRIVLILADGTIFDDGAGHEPAITDADIMDGSFKIESASSGTSTLDLGAAVIGMCKFSLRNFDERFSQYDFFGATASVWVKLDGDSDYVRMGFYTVDEPQYAGSIVSLELLDNMYRFDVPMTNLTFPCTCLQAVNTVCSHCGVLLATQTFHGSDFQLTVAPDQEMTCRDFLQYVAMITCNFCTMNDQGNLVLKWYETSAGFEDSLDGGTFSTNTTPYSDGDEADGGNFTNYASGDDYDGGTFTDAGDRVWFTRNFSLKEGTDEITVTGVKIIIDDVAHMVGTDGYVLQIENPLVDATNVNAVLSLIWDTLEGFKFRTFNASSLPDITAELGDACAIRDQKGNTIYSYISLIEFSPSLMTTQFNAETPSRKLSMRLSKSVQTALEEAKKQTDKQISRYDVAVNQMNNLAVNAMGGFQDYEDLSTGGRVYYLSNKPITKSGGVCSFDLTATVFKMTGEGFFVSFPPTPPSTERTWTNGYSGGELVVNVLNAIGISAEWILTGLLTIGGSSYEDTAHLEVKDPNDVTVVTLDKDGIDAQKGVIGDVSLENGEQFVIGDLFLKEKTWTSPKATGKYTTLVTFTPALLFTKSPSTYLKVAYRFADLETYRGLRFELQEYTSGTWGIIETAIISPVSGEEGYIQFQTALAGTNTNRMRVRVYTTSAESAKQKIYFVMTLLNVHKVSVSADGFYGEFHGTYEGKANLTSGTIGAVDIDSYDITAQEDNWSLNINNYRIYTGSDSEEGYGRHIALDCSTAYMHAVEGSGSDDAKIQIDAYDDPSIYVYSATNRYIQLEKNRIQARTNSTKVINLSVVDDPALFLRSAANNYIDIDNEYISLTYDADNHCSFSRYTLQAYRDGQPYSIPWTSSDGRYKEEIEDLDSDLSKNLIDATQPKKFKYKSEEGKHYGMIAQEARELLDSLGETDAQLEYCSDEKNDINPRNINYTEYIPHLINYVKDLRAELNRVKAELNELKEGK